MSDPWPVNPFESPRTPPNTRHRYTKRAVRIALVLIALGLMASCVPNVTEYIRLKQIADPAHPDHRIVVPTQFGAQGGMVVAKMAFGVAILLAALNPRQQ
jgi:hypothetical protein